MWIRMPPHYRNAVRLNPERIVYKGKRDELMKYFVDKILFLLPRKWVEAGV